MLDVDVDLVVVAINEVGYQYTRVYTSAASNSNPDTLAAQLSDPHPGSRTHYVAILASTLMPDPEFWDWRKVAQTLF